MSEKFPGGATSHVAGEMADPKAYLYEVGKGVQQVAGEPDDAEPTPDTRRRFAGLQREVLVFALLLLAVLMIAGGIFIVLGIGWSLVTMGALLLLLGLLLGLSS